MKTSSSQFLQLYDLMKFMLAYPYDKQHKLKMVYLRCLVAVATGLISRGDSGNAIIEFSVVESLLKLMKPLQKIQTVMALCYQLLHQVNMFFEYSYLFCQLFENGSHQWFLATVLKDFTQKKSSFEVMNILLLICESENICAQLEPHRSHLSALISSSQNEELNILLYKVYVQIMGHKGDDTVSQILLVFAEISVNRLEIF